MECTDSDTYDQNQPTVLKSHSIDIISEIVKSELSYNVFEKLKVRDLKKGKA